MDAASATLADEAASPRWTAEQQRVLQHLASALPAAQPPPVNVRVWESESFITHRGPQGRALNVSFEHPLEHLWHVELFLDDEGRFQVWLLRGDDTHLDALPYEPERFVDDLLSGSLAFTVVHYAERVARIAANRADVTASFLIPPANVGLRARLTTRRRNTVLRWNRSA